jgi:protein-S-isoprenylcysteine O-methyltransferase Ste14
MRNPLYAGLVVALGGLAATVGSWRLLGAAAIALASAHVWVVAIEEPRLVARFGDAYVAYLRRVPRWLPSPRRPADPVTP